MSKSEVAEKVDKKGRKKTSVSIRPDLQDRAELFGMKLKPKHRFADVLELALLGLLGGKGGSSRQPNSTVPLGDPHSLLDYINEHGNPEQREWIRGNLVTFAERLGWTPPTGAESLTDEQLRRLMAEEKPKPSISSIRPKRQK